MIAAKATQSMPPEHSFPFLAATDYNYWIITDVHKDFPKVWCGVCIAKLQPEDSVPHESLRNLFKIGDKSDDLDSTKFVKIDQIVLTSVRK